MLYCKQKGGGILIFSAVVSEIMALVSEIIFFGFPIAAIVYFIVSLVRFVRAHLLSKKFPDLVLEDKMTSLRRHLIISSVIMGVLLAVVVGFGFLLAMAVAYM